MSERPPVEPEEFHEEDRPSPGLAVVPHPVLTGYGRFREERYPRLQALFQRLEGGQSPKVLFITCSDSRVDPCLLTQTLPGELFVLRNAGNIVPPFREDSAEGATIEYAIQVLKTPHIVVCGHSGCGAMAGLLALDQLAALPGVRRWVRQSEPALAHVDSQHHSSEDEKLTELVRQNVLLQLERLRSYPFIDAATASGRLCLHGWVYDIGSGAVLEYDAPRRQFADPRKLAAVWT